MFKIGDKVYSDEYGNGIVKGSELDYVLVDFYDDFGKLYHEITGKRDPVCGSDSIHLRTSAPKNRKSLYIRGRRVISLDDLYNQEFVIWHGKVYHSGWVHSWQIQFASNAIYSKDGIWVANKIRRV